MLELSNLAYSMLSLFAIGGLGYLISAIHFHGFSFGSVAIFIVALLFGHLGFSFPHELQTFGLILFMAAVGYSAGPGFLTSLRKSGLRYLVICLSTALTGSVIAFFVIRFGRIEAPLAIGIMTGAFTTSPGFAAAKEAAGDASAYVAAGYGMAYPIGITMKILFMQLFPRILHVDMAEERKLVMSENHDIPESRKQDNLFKIDRLGLFPFSLAAVSGVLLGALTIPLPGGGSFSLGSTGGVLITSLILASFGKIGKISLEVDKSLIAPSKEIGLLLFFTGAGTEGGRNLARTFGEYGFAPLLYAFIFVLLPLLTGYLLFSKILRIPLLNGLASMTASMTCTPSLAVLMQVAGTDSIATVYATTYPIALIVIIFTVQLLLKI